MTINQGILAGCIIWLFFYGVKFETSGLTFYINGLFKSYSIGNCDHDYSVHSEVKTGAIWLECSKCDQQLIIQKGDEDE